MGGQFDYFVVLAGMRTGSNFLETNLNAFPSISCLGEAFNPYFLGYPNRTELLGFTQAQRDVDPVRLIDRIRAERGLAGFRLFHDHDTRARAAALPDPRCAKIVLTRNPLESYVSWKIARETGQWKLTDVARRRAAQIRFDPAEFAAHLDAQQGFLLEIRETLQTTGQTAFYLDYEDLRSIDVMNGLAVWLGIDERIEALDQSLKPQNPGPLRDKVANPDAMERTLARLDAFSVSRTPIFEPRRGPAAPSYIAAAEAPLLFLPVSGAPVAEVRTWLAALDDATEDQLRSSMSQKDLRQWKRRHPGHRSFTILRHPAARAHAVFCARILQTGPGCLSQIRDTLRRVHRLPIPKSWPDEGYDRAAHRTAFRAFLEFLRANLAGQTAIRVDSAWASQSQILQGFGEFAPPDHVWREEEWRSAAADLSARMGLPPVPAPDAASDEPFQLADIHDADIETEIRQIYQRDFMMFGFGPWRASGAAD